MSDINEQYLNGEITTDNAETTDVFDAWATKHPQYKVGKSLHEKLNSILADEFLAYVTYKMCEVAMVGRKQNLLDKIANSNGWDELDDHFRKLSVWMQSCGLSVVTDIEEMRKITNCTKFAIKDGMKTSEVVDILIKSEKEAIGVYESILKDKEVQSDLTVLLSGFLTDEREHLKKLEDAKAEMKD